MSMTNITIEQLRADKWVADVWVGGLVGKNEHLTASNRHEIIMLVMNACDRLEGQDPRRRIEEGKIVPVPIPDGPEAEELEELDKREADIDAELVSASSSSVLGNLPRRGRPRKGGWGD